MKRFAIIFAFVAVVLLVVVFFYQKGQQRQYICHDRLSADEVSQLRAGDIILRKGFGVVSASIAKALDEDFSVSHCGIVDADSNGGLRVIHSVSASLSDFDGLQECSIREFCRESREKSLIVVRFRDTSDVPLASLAKTAQKYLDRKIPFDGVFDLSDNAEMYCSEMVYCAMRETFGYDIYPDKSKTEVVKFTPFFDTTRFYRVINHNIK